MNFSLDKTIEILQQTPQTLTYLLDHLSNDWTSNNEGGETWSPYDVVGHLIHADKTNWLLKVEMILSNSTEKKFENFDRFAQFENSKGKTLTQLLAEFSTVRKTSIDRLEQFNITQDDLNKTGIHPAFGEVTLSQLLSTWTVHDLDHIAQIVRVMGKQYKEAVGPWVEYLKILKQ